MSLKEFLNQLQQRVLRLRTSLQKSHPGRLRVLNLEDRRLLDATAGFLGGQLLLDGFQNADSLSVNLDAGGHLDFDLTGSQWATVSDPGLSLLNAGQTLRLDAANVADLRSLDINAGDAALSGIAANAALNLNSLEIQNGGVVQLSDLAVSLDASIDADSVSDFDGSQFAVSGNASFTADTIFLGDHDTDTTEFGSLTFTATGHVSISEDSAMAVSGSNSAGTLSLTSSGAITNATASSLDVVGATVLSADSIELNDAGGSVVNFGSVSFAAIGDVVLHESSDLSLAADSNGGDVELNAIGNIDSFGSASITADVLSLSAEESVVSAGTIGSALQDLQFDSDSITTQSDGDQFLASTGTTSFSSLQAVDTSTLFDSDSSATISLNAGEFTGSGSGVSGGLFVADDVSLSSDGTIADVTLSADSDVTFRIESTSGVSGGTLGDFDQWHVADSVNLGGASLTIADQNLLANGTTIRLIDNSGSAVVGTFSGLSEGDLLTGTSGQRYQISYVGGDGNDVTLTALTSTFSFASTTESVFEDVAGGQKLITVNRTGDTSAADSVAVNISGVTASQGTDFGSATTVTASFAAGEASTTVAVAIADDDVVEANETLSLQLAAPADGLVDSSRSAATLSILNDDVTTIRFQLTSSAVVEGDSGTTTATYNVTSSHAVDSGFTIGVSSRDLQTIAGTDYVLQTNSLSFAGTASEVQTIDVLVMGETLFEDDEAFDLVLGSVTTANTSIAIGTAFSVGSDLEVSLTNDDTKSLAVLNSGALTVSDETLLGEANDWTLSFDSTTNEVVVTSSTENLGTGSAVAVSELRFDAAAITGDIVFEGRGGDDVLKVDFSNGNPLVGAELQFDGGSQSLGGAGDGLFVVGDGVLNAVYQPDEMTFGDGQIQVGGSSIRFRGLEPVDVSGFATATLTLPGAADVLTIQDGRDYFAGGINDALRVSGTSGGIAIETAAFWNNTSLVIDTVDSGSDGIDVITVVSASGDHSNTNLQINTGATAGDEIRINGSVNLAGDLSLTSDAIIVNTSAIVAGNEQDFVGDVVIDSNLALTADTVTFWGTVNSATGETNSLVVTGDAVFSDAVGASSELSALTISGITEVGNDVSTAAQQSYGDSVVLTGSAVLTSSASGNVVFSDTVNGAHSLTVNTAGATRFMDVVGATVALTSLTTDAAGATTVSGGAITTTGMQTFHDALVLTDDTVLTATVVNLHGGVGGGNNDLTITGDLNLQSNLSGLVDLDVSGESDLNGNLSTTGRQEFRDAVTLQGDVSTSANGLQFFDTVDGDYFLNASGGVVGVTFDQSVGAGTALSGMDVSGTTVGFSGAVNVADQGLEVASVSATTFDADVRTTSGGTVVLNNGGLLTLADGIDFQLDGSFQQTGAGEVTAGANIFTTADAISFASTVTQTAAVMLSSTAGGNSAGAHITVQEVIAGGNNFSLDAGTSGNVETDAVRNVGELTVVQSASSTFQDAVSATTLALLDTVQDIVFQANLVASNLQASAEEFAVQLLEDTTITNSVVFSNTGGVQLGDATDDIQTFHGGITSSVSMNSIQGIVQTSSENLILGETTLADVTSLLTGTGGGNISVGQIGGSGIQLTANAGAGAIDLGNSANVIGDLTIIAHQATIAEADNVTQSSAWLVTGDVSVSAVGNDIVLTNAMNQLGDVTLTANTVQLSESADITVDSINVVSTVQLTTSAAINDASSDSATDISAASVMLSAASGIGASERLELQTASVTASTTTGDIQLHNTSATATLIQSLSTTTGDISFSQDGSGDVSIQTVSNDSGDINIASAASGLTLSGTVTAGSGDVSLESTTANVVLEGAVTAVDQTVSVSAGGAIEGDASNTSPDVVADKLVVSAANGIGIVSPLETSVTELALMTTGAGGTRLVNATKLEVTSANLSGDLELCVTTGDLTISGLVNASGQSVLLQADSGQVIETAAGTLISDELGVNAATGIDLAQSSNNVTTFAATSAVGNIRFLESDGFGVTTIAASGCFDAVTGVTAFGAGTIDLSSIAGPLDLNAVVQSEDGSISIESLNGAVGLNSNVASDSADINVEGNQIQQAASLTTADAGQINVVADDGDVVMDAAATTTTQVGTIAVTATGSVTLAAVSSTSGGIAITADSGGNSIGSIADSNGAIVNLATSGTTTLSSGSGIDVDTDLPAISATVSGTGDIAIDEVDTLVLTNVATADGSVVVTANGELTAMSVQAGADAADSVSLSTTTGDLIATSVAASGQVILNADSGNTLLASVESTLNNVTVTAAAGDVQLNSVVANSVGATISINASGDIIDDNGAAVNLSATSGTVSLTGSNIGSAGDSVFKPTVAVPLEIDASVVNVAATGVDPDGSVAVHLLSDSSVETVSGNHIFISGDGDIDLSSATAITNSLSVITTSGAITLPATLTVVDDLRLEAAQITSSPGPEIDLNANRILFVSGSAAKLSITAAEFDGVTGGNLTVSNDSVAVQLTDLNCDLTAINTNGGTSVLNQLGGGTTTQQLPADSTQNSRVLSDSLLLTGTGTFELTNTDNDISTFAADTTGSVAYTDLDSFAVGTIQLTTGITTGSQDLLLQAGQSLDLQQQINAGTADARIVVGAAGTVGNVTQDAAGTITATALAVRNDAAAGDLVMAAENDVDVFSSANAAADGDIVFQDSDELTIGSVSDSLVPDAVFSATEGIQANDGNITIASGATSIGSDSLLLDNVVSAGSGTVRLIAEGNISQAVSGTIEAEALAVRQVGATGDVILDDGNRVTELAIDNTANAGLVGFRNLQSLTVGTVAASISAASPDTSALQFDQTVGVSTNNGDIQLSVDGPLTADGSLQLNAGVSAGTASVGIATDGAIQQTTNGAINAADLLVRQQAESSNFDISLGTAANDVANVAMLNVSEEGSFLFNDASELTIASVTVADIGNLSIPAVVGIHSDAGDINITATGDLRVDEDINAASDTSTTSIDESITLISRSGDFILTDGTTISTDENPAPGAFEDSTGDRIQILAGTDGAAGSVHLENPNTIEIRTDGGLAKQIAPRPTGFTSSPTSGAQTAFVTLTDAAGSRSNLTFQSDGFLGELEFVFGIAGEENLEVVVDWGVVTLVDLTANGIAGDATLLPSGTYAFDQSDGDKSIFYIDEGGQRYQISHIYETGDLITTPNDRNGRQFNPNIIGARFSVAQHESINIWGLGAVDPTTGTTVSVAEYTGSAASVTDASGNTIAPTSVGLSLLSSTDTNGLRNLTAEASSQFPLVNRELTSSGTPEGLAEWEFIAGPSPGIILFQPTERFVTDLPEIVAPIDATVISEISGDAFFGDGAASDASVGTDVYLQIRRYFELDAEAEIVIARINDSDLISSRQAFEEFVAANPELQDGAGYEVWLVTETGGQRVERPVVQFEVTGGRPGPPTETMLGTDQPVRLQDVEFRQADDPEPANSSEQAPSTEPGDQASGTPSQPTPVPIENGGNEGDQRQSNWSPESENHNHRHIFAATQAGTASFDGTNEINDDNVSAADSGVSESTAVAGIAATSYSAVSRFRSRQNSSDNGHSVTSRTMRLLRGTSDLKPDSVQNESS